MTSRQAASITADFSEIENGMNVIRSMAKALQSPRVRDGVMKVLHQQANSRFLQETDVHAASGKDPNISHMYDWERAGNPKSRLFKMTWQGSGGRYKGDITFLPASMEIPVPISRAHQAYIEGVNSSRSPGKSQVRLARYIWLDKALQLETKNRFPISVQGRAVKKDGWIRVRDGNPAPARNLMVEVGGEIKFFKTFTLKYNQEGKFTAHFHMFWTENEFKKNEFERFERRYNRAIRKLFAQEINRAKISTPMYINAPGINFYSNGRRDLSLIGGRERVALVKRYEKRILRELTTRDARF